MTKDTEDQKKDSPIKNTDESSLVAGTGISFISFRMDIKGGLSKEKLGPLCDLPFTFPCSLLKQAFNAPGNEKANLFRLAFQW